MPSFHRINKKTGISVLEKFNYKCQICGSAKNLCVHHIERMSPTDINYNDEQNLTVVCRSCHMRLHREAGHIVPSSSPPPGNPYGRRGKRPPIKCTEDGCDRLQHARGLCKKHYEYKRKRGLL